MSSPKKRKIVDTVNEPRILSLTSQTYSYGETPAAVCRQQFQDIAQSLNLTPEELAQKILESSTEEQLTLLGDFYKTSYSEDIPTFYKSLIAEDSKSLIPLKKVCAVKKVRNAPSHVTKKEKTPVRKTTNKPKPKTSKISLVMPNEEELSIPTPQQSRTRLPHAENLEDSTTSRVQNVEDTEETLRIDTNQAQSKQPAIPSAVIPSEDDNAKDDDSLQHPRQLVAAPNKESKCVEEDLETFLYGKPPERPKASPRKKKLQKTMSQSDTTSSLSATVPSDHILPTASHFSTPRLTFETSTSDISRQRDLLSVARDIAELQKSIAAGKRPTTSVKDAILFTK